MQTLGSLTTDWRGLGMAASLFVLGACTEKTLLGKVTLTASLFFCTSIFTKLVTNAMVARGWVSLSTAAKIEAFSAITVTIAMVALFLFQSLLGALILGVLGTFFSALKVAKCFNKPQLIEACLNEAESSCDEARRGFLNAAYKELRLLPQTPATNVLAGRIFDLYSGTLIKTDTVKALDISKIAQNFQVEHRMQERRFAFRHFTTLDSFISEVLKPEYEKGLVNLELNFVST